MHELKERWKPTVVIVYIHWGTEGQACPNGDQKAFAPVMAAAGADILIGTHAHTLLADDRLAAPTCTTA